MTCDRLCYCWIHIYENMNAWKEYNFLELYVNRWLKTIIIPITKETFIGHRVAMLVKGHKNEKKIENCTMLIPKGNAYCRRKSSARRPRFNMRLVTKINTWKINNEPTALKSISIQNDVLVVTCKVTNYPWQGSGQRLFEPCIKVSGQCKSLHFLAFIGIRRIKARVIFPFSRTTTSQRKKWLTTISILQFMHFLVCVF